MSPMVTVHGRCFIDGCPNPDRTATAPTQLAARAANRAAGHAHYMAVHYTPPTTEMYLERGLRPPTTGAYLQRPSALGDTR